MTTPTTQPAATQPPADSQWQWHDLGEPEGRAWADVTRRYDRLPTRAEALIPEEVWNLSRQSAGQFNRFRTDATEVRARWTVGTEPLARSHMPASSVSGLDLYRTDDHDTLRWVGVGRPEAPTNDVELAGGLDGAERDYVVWFPLYNRLEQVEIGVNDGASFTRLPPDTTRPVLYYGTSIIHGAAASRPGMALPAILTRRLGRTVLNLGFSGNGKMEEALGHLFGEIDAAVFVVDCLPNMEFELVRDRALPFLRALRERRPDTPIVLVEDRTYANAWAIPARQQRQQASRRELRAAYDTLVAEGDRHLTYLTGDSLLAADGEDTVDSSHPTDLGFVHLADVLEPVLRGLLA